MMAISAQKNKIHSNSLLGVGSYFDPKLKLKGIRLNISSWRRPSRILFPGIQKPLVFMICTLSKHEAESKGYTDSHA